MDLFNLNNTDIYNIYTDSPKFKTEVDSKIRSFLRMYDVSYEDAKQFVKKPSNVPLSDKIHPF